MYERVGNGTWELSGTLYATPVPTQTPVAASVAISDDGLVVAVGEGSANANTGEHRAYRL